MPTIKELKEQCKKLGLKKYSTLKKGQLEQLIKKVKDGTHIVPAKSFTVLELKKMCREKKHKNCSKLKKHELEILLLGAASKKESPKGKKEAPKGKKFNRLEKIKIMKQKAEDHYDPIFMQEFDTWDDKDLKNAVLLGKHYYLPSTLFDHVKTKLKQQKAIVKDPMTGEIISEEKIKEIYKANGQEFKKPTKFIFDHSIMNLRILENPIVYIQGWPFQKILLNYNQHQIKITAPSSSRASPNSLIIGYVPMGISLTPTHHEVKALDASSTSEVLLARIISLVESGRLFKNVKNKSMSLVPIKGLPKNRSACNKWLVHKRIATNKTSCYIHLLDELTELES